MTLLFENATILTMTTCNGEPLIVKGAVGVVGDKIVMVTSSVDDIEKFKAEHTDAERFDLSGKLLMPGLINTHCHAAMTLQRGNADDISLMSWLNDYIWPFESRQTVEDVKVGMELAIAEMLLGGITSFVDMYFYEDECVEVADRMGIRALLGCSFFDHSIDEAERTIERAVERAKGSSTVNIAVAPHAPYTVSVENLLRSKAICERYDLPFMTHISETRDEVKIMQERYGCTSTEHLDSLGLLTPKTIGAHCIHLTDSDIVTLAERGVVVSHNPHSNMKISSGVAPLEALREAGATITIGTDGSSSNNDLDLFEEVRTATFLQKSATGSPLALPAYEALKMATVNGSAVMGYSADELGVIKVGALADLIVIDMQKPHLQPIHNVVSNIIYCGKASDVDTVVVAGRVVVRHRELIGVDLPELFKRVEGAINTIVQRTH